MKLRIDSGSIRLRLMPDDVAKFAGDRVIEESVAIDAASGVRLLYRLKADRAAERLTVTFENNRLSINVPEDEALRWSSGDEVELRSGSPASEKDAVKIVVEKDTGCRHPRS